MDGNSVLQTVEVAQNVAGDVLSATISPLSHLEAPLAGNRGSKSVPAILLDLNDHGCLTLAMISTSCVHTVFMQSIMLTFR